MNQSNVDSQTRTDLPAAPAAAAGNRGGAIVALLGFLGAFITNANVIAFVAPGMRLLDELQIDAALFGLIQSGHTIGSVLVMLLGGGIMQRLRDNTILLLAFALLTAANLIASLSSVPLLVLSRLMLGAASGGLVFTISRLTFLHYARYRTFIVGMTHASFLAGSLAMMLLGGEWHLRAGNWRLFSIQLAILSVWPILPILVWCPANKPAPVSRTVPLRIREVWQPIAYRLTIPATATYLFGEFGIIFFLPLYMQQYLGGSLREVAVGGSLFLVMLLLGRLVLCARLSQADERRVLPPLAVAAWIFPLLALLPLPLFVRAILLGFGGFLMGPVAVMILNLGVRMAGGHLDHAILITNILFSAGGIAGTAATGLVGKHFGLQVAILFGVMTSLLAVLPLFMIPRLRQATATGL